MFGLLSQSSLKQLGQLLESLSNLSKFMEQNLYIKAKSFSSSRNSPHFKEPATSLLCSQKPTTGPIRSQYNPVYTPFLYDQF